MKTRHFILAVLALLCSATLFTACGSDDDETPANNDAPAYVAMSFYLQLTDDMLNYFDIQVSTVNGAGQTDAEIVTKDNPNFKDGVYSTMVVGPLPCELTVTKTITVKENANFDNVESFKYYTTDNGYYEYWFHNAKKEVIKDIFHKGGNSSTNPLTIPAKNVQKFIDQVKEGKLTHTFVYSFDKDGKLLNNEYLVD